MATRSGQCAASLDAGGARGLAAGAAPAARRPGLSLALFGRTPERVLIAPPDLRLADPQIALEIYYGRFPLAGHLVETGGKSPFQLDIANPPG